MDQSLVVDAAGNAMVAVYSIYAPTADSELVERLNLYTFAADLSALGPPVSFRGIGKPHLAGEASGAILVGGNAINNAAHGTLTRLEAGEPGWIQTRVPTSGQGAGVGVSGLVVDEAGASAMLSQRSKRWESGADLYTYGVSTFDADGKPGWDLVLPTPYQGGYVAALASNGQGELVVAGYGYGSDEDLLVRSVSPEGELGWAYRVPSDWPNAHVDAQTGRTFVTGRDKVAIIEPGGQLCSYLEVPRKEGALAYGLGDVIVQEPYVYTMTGEGIARYELPEASLATSDLASE
jgi:hypothetical protein